MKKITSIVFILCLSLGGLSACTFQDMGQMNRVGIDDGIGGGWGSGAGAAGGGLMGNDMYNNHRSYGSDHH